MNKRDVTGRNDDSLAAYLLGLGQQGKSAASVLSIASTDNKNNALRLMAEALGDAESIILEANECDIETASELDDALIDRLKLSPQRVSDMVSGVLSVAALPDPVGFVTSPWYHPEKKTNIAMGYVPFDGTLSNNGFPTGKVGQKFKVHLPDEYADSPGVPVDAEVVSIPFTESYNANTREVSKA